MGHCLWHNRDCDDRMLREHFGGLSHRVLYARLMTLSGVDMMAKLRMERYADNRSENKENVGEMKKKVETKDVLSIVSAGKGVSMDELVAKLGSIGLVETVQDMCESFLIY